jgi:UDPglucose--hexose-1-phosphate uridylyltransferase
MTNHPNTFEGKWEQRWHPLRREWVVYSAHRQTRPWQGATEKSATDAPSYDPDCYLCPGNVRVSGKRNPNYEDVFVFDNDHPVVGMDAPDVFPSGAHPTLYRKTRADGIARVVCYDPRHNVTLSDVPLDSVRKVLAAWREQVRELSEMNNVRFILIFENKGEITGTSNPHPHCQIYATNFVFNNVERELDAVRRYRDECGATIFDHILEAEQTEGARVVAENEHALAFVPFFARYSYEVWVFPKRRHATLTTLSDDEIAGLAAVYQELNRRYDLLFDLSFPYVMSLYQAPVDGGDYADYHLRFVFLPPLRRPGLQKFPAGPEIGGGNFMCDTMPEEKAAELRGVNLSCFQPKTSTGRTS